MKLLSLNALSLVSAIGYVSADLLGDLSRAEKRVGQEDGSGNSHSLNVSTCPGYTLSALSDHENGLTAMLDLAGQACNAFGHDIANLTIEVTYVTASRLHVKIADTNNSQFVIPESVFARPEKSGPTVKDSSDLVFNYVPSPFAFWVTRRSDPDAMPLFDTRTTSLPPTPIRPYNASQPSTAFDGFPLVFEDQYLQLTSSLPLDANVYGLGEVVASSGFRRAIAGDGTIQTMWNRDGEPIDQNIYGSHPIYLEHRIDEDKISSQSHGVFLLSSAGADILLATPSGSNVSLIEYRMLGGILDFYFFSGPTPNSVIEQYGALIGLPTWQPLWTFGFQLCRWGYGNVSATREQVENMRAANIPLEVMWNDIDIFHALRDFTSDPVSFPGDEMREFIRELSSNNQHYVPIVDAAIAHPVNDTDDYDVYYSGESQKVFVANPDGSEYIGQVWPGYTVFPDWFANSTQQWWTQALQNWSDSGIEYSGIWLDMNEASSFCDGSCGTNATDTVATIPFQFFPGSPGNEVTQYPECYNSSISGASGNLTVNGVSTYSCGSAEAKNGSLAPRGVGSGNQSDVDLNAPPYTIHNGEGALSLHTISPNATHVGGYAELDVHNLWGLMEEKATHTALTEIRKNQRPFIISRSTFPSSGKWTGHWLGDNQALWSYMYFSIQGVLQFQLFQIPFVGADTCGFSGNTDEELCNRWMQLSAFHPFYRNHNQRAAISQEPYRWESVANASRIAIGIRYSLLPYWYTLFANSSALGTPPMRALFFEFPSEKELLGVDNQFMVGSAILVTPVLQPNATTVQGIFPGRGSVRWRDWYTHGVVNAPVGANTTLSAPLSHINVHLRDGSAILMYAKPQYTVEETRQGPFALLVSQARDGSAHGTAYLDDGASYPPGPNKTLTFTASKGNINIRVHGSYAIEQKLRNVTVLGAIQPAKVLLNGKEQKGWSYAEGQEKLVIPIDLDLNKDASIVWQV